MSLLSKDADDQMSEWLGLLSDEARADVLKVQIAECEKTKRTRIESERAVKCNLHSDGSYHFVRGLFVVVLGLIVLGTTCVSYHHLEIEAVKAGRPLVPLLQQPLLK